MEIDFKLVKNLPETLKVWVLNHQMTRNGFHNLEVDFESDEYSRNFKWDETPEGYDFWYCIHHDLSNIITE